MDGGAAFIEGGVRQCKAFGLSGRYVNILTLNNNYIGTTDLFYRKSFLCPANHGGASRFIISLIAYLLLKKTKQNFLFKNLRFYNLHSIYRQFKLCKPKCSSLIMPYHLNDKWKSSDGSSWIKTLLLSLVDIRHSLFVLYKPTNL